MRTRRSHPDACKLGLRVSPGDARSRACGLGVVLGLGLTSVLLPACSAGSAGDAAFGHDPPGAAPSGTPVGAEAGTLGAGDGGTAPPPESVDGGGTPDASGGAFAAVCTTAGQALCGKVEACWSTLMTEAYGDVGTCVQRFTLQCERQLAAPGTGWTPAYVQGCYAAIAAGTCAGYFDGALPAACTPPGGQVADGAACGESGQCAATSSCRKASGSYCGTCTARAAQGASCAAADCPQGLICNSATTCAAYATAGAACSASEPCGFPLHCKGSKCVEAAQLGAACSSTSDTCDVTAGLYCDTTTSKCAAVQFVAAGATCGSAGGALSVCNAGGACGGTSGATTGTCVAPAADGAPCNPGAGPFCMAPAYCNGGVCTLPDASSCH